VPAALAEHAVDVVVMDLRMKRVDGIEATRRLAAAGGPPVLALTTFNEDELLSGVLRAGAAGFVLKDSSAEELIRAVRAVAHGDSYLDSRGDRPRAQHLPQVGGGAAAGPGQRTDRAGTRRAHLIGRATPTPRSPSSCSSPG
jgi:DNA-binding NarL/FixJ family response regulator